MTDDGADEVVRAAERQRARAAAESRAADLAATADDRKRARREAWVRRNRTREALAEAGRIGRIASYVAIGVGLLGPMAIAIFVLDLGDSILATFGAAIASLVGAFAAVWLTEQIFAARRLRRLIAVGRGRGLDVDSYLAALGEARHRGVVVVRVTSARRWPDDARRSAPDAVREWMPSLVLVEWDGDTLVLKSTELDGTVWYAGGSYTSGGRHFENTAFHGCFMKIARDVLPRVEKVAPIARLAVAIEGSVEDWDAEP